MICSQETRSSSGQLCYDWLPQHAEAGAEAVARLIADAVALVDARLRVATQSKDSRPSHQDAEILAPTRWSGKSFEPTFLGTITAARSPSAPGGWDVRHGPTTLAEPGPPPTAI